MKPVRTVDLFCGAGGSSWGARRAGAQIAAGFDCWDLAIEAFQLNFPEACPFLEDLRELDPHHVARQVGPIDLMLASPECTNHGPAKGGRRRCELSRGTAFQVPRLAAALAPRWIIVENVSGMRSWRRYAEFVSELRGLGYHTSEQLLNAADFGVPQARRRLYLLADKEGEPSFRPPGPRARRSAELFVDLDGRFNWSKLRAPGRAEATIARAERAFQQVGESEPFLIVYYGTDQAGGWQRLDAPLRTVTTLDRFAVVKPAPEGHLMRMLQVPELKAAMGMPKRFKTAFGSRRNRIKLLGNAVCPPVMEHLVRCLVRGGR